VDDHATSLALILRTYAKGLDKQRQHRVRPSASSLFLVLNEGELMKSVGEICDLITKHHWNFTPEVKPLNQVQQHVIKWELPPPDYVKVNFDASFCPGSA
jgi:hypothetical protein